MAPTEIKFQVIRRFKGGIGCYILFNHLSAHTSGKPISGKRMPGIKRQENYHPGKWGSKSVHSHLCNMAACKRTSKSNPTYRSGRTRSDTIHFETIAAENSSGMIRTGRGTEDKWHSEAVWWGRLSLMLGGGESKQNKRCSATKSTAKEKVSGIYSFARRSERKTWRGVCQSKNGRGGSDYLELNSKKL